MVELTPENEPISGTEDKGYANKKAAEGSASAKRSSRLLVFFLVLVVLTVGGYVFVSKSSNSDVDKIQGKVALSAQELIDVVAAKRLTVYWVGPQEGAKYSLIVSSPTLAYLRYLPGGVGLTDTKTLFRIIGTYSMKDAFTVVTNTGSLLGNVGFTNADGNSVFYSTSRTTNVYVGIKGKDTQVEIYDPGADQSVGMVTIKGQLRRVA